MRRSRISNKRKRVLLNLAKRRSKRRLQQKRDRTSRRKFNLARANKLEKRYPKVKIAAEKNGKKRRENKGYRNLNVPEQLDLIKNYDETIEFIKTIKAYAYGLRKSVRLIFDETKEISPEALLLLLAELYRCRKIFGDKRVTGTYPKSKKIEKIMEASGFFDLLEVVPRSPAKEKQYPLCYIKFITGNRLVESTARVLREALLGENIKMGTIAKKRLYRAITEAMINVVQHAYPKKQRGKHQIRNNWWISGHVNQRSGRLVILFCDLGVGIPNTLPKVHGWEKIRSVLAILPGVKPNDAQMINAGMEIGRTSTGLAGRGKGLNDLKMFVDDTGGGELNIFSRRGHYKYEVGQPVKLTNHDASICGTLIRWSVPLSNVTDWITNMGENYDENEEN